MTIHSDWSRLLHQECPDAFTKQVPANAAPDVGIIDGHLQLMSLHAGLQSWNKFVQYLFVKPIEALFTQGCKRVVLCFDSYSHVPVYKSITQQKRCSRMVEIKTFQAHWELPSCIPSDTMQYLMNRHFKLKVIDKVLQLLPIMLTLLPEQTFMVDYKTVVEYTLADQWVPRPVADLVPLGESDIKFCRYVTKYGNALVHAIDGDYLAIALLYYANAEPSARNRIYIYRQLSVLQDSAEQTKRKREPHKKVMCWVHMQKLQEAIVYIVKGCGFKGSAQDTTRAAVRLMLCAGTDFSRGLPLLGPRRMWETLPCIAKNLASDAFADDVVARLYVQVFAKHASLGCSLQGVLAALQQSALSKRTKQLLPSMSQVEVTLLNLQWVEAYWTTHNSCVETPTSGENGYTAFQRHVQYSDLLSSASSRQAA